MRGAKAVAGLVVLLAGALAPVRALSAPDPDLGVHPLPLDGEGRVALADLLGVVLAEAGSRVRLFEAAVEGRLDVRSPTGQLAVAALTVALAPVGITARVEGDVLVVRVDRPRLSAQIDQLEAVLRDALGVGPHRYALEQPPGAGRKGPPVVLIHGLDSRPESLEAARAALAARGWDAYHFRYPNDARVEETARHLGTLLRALRDGRGRRVSVVTVSLGGLVARAYLELDPAYAGEVDRFVACAPPFGGAPIARYHALLEAAETVRDVLGEGLAGLFPFDGLGQAAGDLLPDSPLLRRLAKAPRRAGVRYSILAGDGRLVPDEAFDVADALLAAWRDAAAPDSRVGLDLVQEAVEEARRVAGGLGDGAVALDSQALPGVTDRVVLPYHHLAFLAGDPAGGPIPALEEVARRLPRP